MKRKAQCVIGASGRENIGSENFVREGSFLNGSKTSLLNSCGLLTVQKLRRIDKICGSGRVLVVITILQKMFTTYERYIFGFEDTR